MALKWSTADECVPAVLIDECSDLTVFQALAIDAEFNLDRINQIRGNWNVAITFVSDGVPSKAQRTVYLTDLDRCKLRANPRSAVTRDIGHQ